MTDIDWKNIESILVHKPDHIGDALCAAPAIGLLREAAPHAKIFAGTTPASGAFLRALRLTDEDYALPGPSWWRTAAAWKYIAWARRRRFGLVVNFRYDARDIFLARFLGSKTLCTFTHKGIGRSAAHPAAPPREDKPEMLNHLDLVAALGLRAEHPFRAEIDTKDAARAEELLRPGSRWIAFHPFARTAAKGWDPAKARETARLLAARGFRIVLIGSGGHAGESKNFIADNPNVLDLTGRTTPGLLMAVIARSDLLITTDSAPGHIAPLVGSKVLALMSGTNRHARWAPRGSTIVGHDVSCAPCALEICNVPGHPCMSGIEPERVAAEAERILKG